MLWKFSKNTKKHYFVIKISKTNKRKLKIFVEKLLLQRL